MAKAAHVSQSTGNQEWYTPKNIVDAARNVMKGIDLDPASSYVANKIVQATRIFTIDDDALALEKTWCGKVWINPPYKTNLINSFSERLLYEINLGHVTQAIWLSNNATETRWGQRVLKQAAVCCFPEKRISFLDSNLNPVSKPLQGQMIIGLGEIDCVRFQNEFTKIGIIR